jgi:hypothetical protein
MRGLARIAVVALVATLAVAVAAPPLAAVGTDDTVADGSQKKKKKKKKHRFGVTCSGEVDHGTGQSDVEGRCTVRDKSKRGRPPVKGATVRGELTEPADGARASGVPSPTDSARTNAAGTASLTFTIDAYGDKHVVITVKKKGFVTATKSYDFTVGPEEGPLFP